jgi:hypothetical protein
MPSDTDRQHALGHLLAVIGGPRTAPASRALWIAAAVLGGLRQASNDPRRAQRRDRGNALNAAGDLQGAFGELLIASLLEAELPDAIVRFDPLRWEGAADDVDARVSLLGHEFLIETKCHLDESRKSLFLVNADAAERSAQRGARSFVPVIARSGSRVAMVGRPILVSAVRSWEIASWGYGDPARSAPLARVSQQQFDRPYRDLLRAISESGVAVEPAALLDAAGVARGRFGELRSGGRSVSRAPGEAIAQLSAIAAGGAAGRPAGGERGHDRPGR